MRNINGSEQAICTYPLQLGVLLLAETRNNLNDPIPDILGDKIPRCVNQPNDYIDIKENILCEFLCQNDNLENELLFYLKCRLFGVFDEFVDYSL